MFFGVYFCNDVLNYAAFINDKSGPCCAHVFAAKHLFFYPCAIETMNGFILVNKQGKRQILLFRKSFVGFL